MLFAVEVIGLPLSWIAGSSLLAREGEREGEGGVGVEAVDAIGFDFDVSWIFGFSLVFLGARSSSSLSERKSRRSSKSSEKEKEISSMIIIYYFAKANCYYHTNKI